MVNQTKKIINEIIIIIENNKIIIIKVPGGQVLTGDSISTVFRSKKTSLSSGVTNVTALPFLPARPAIFQNHFVNDNTMDKRGRDGEEEGECGKGKEKKSDYCWLLCEVYAANACV